MQRQTPLVDGETYHIYNRGAHKGNIFTNEKDYRRFLLLLFLSNDTGNLNLRDLLNQYKGRSFAEVFREEKPDKSLVDVLAFCLMPNHFHFVLKQKSKMGITKFARKILTAYSMYFNTKYEHSGVLSQGRFKSSHVDTEAYFRYIFAYIHLNPLDLIEKGWKEKGIANIKTARKFVSSYPYSSFLDYTVIERPERSLLSYDQRPDFLNTQNDLEELLKCYEDGKNLTKDRPL